MQNEAKKGEIFGDNKANQEILPQNEMRKKISSSEAIIKKVAIKEATNKKVAIQEYPIISIFFFVAIITLIVKIYTSRHYSDHNLS